MAQSASSPGGPEHAAGTGFSRREDARLLTGRGRYTADATEPGDARAAFLRADRAHARILSIETSAAREQPGVIAVLTGEDVAHLATLPVLLPFRDQGLVPLVHPVRPCLARERVRFVGEPVALVLAETQAQALDAMEHIAIEYEDLPCAAGFADARSARAVVHEAAPDNQCFAWQAGDAGAVAQAMARAAHVTRLSMRNQRLVPSPLEPRSVRVGFDAATGAWSFRLGHQGAPEIRRQLAAVLRVEPAQVHILEGDTGGAFGARTPAYPEYGALAVAAQRCARTVSWVSTRSEAFLSEHHGRDSTLHGELALDADGNFLALGMRFEAAMGAYLSQAGVMISTHNPCMALSGPYAFPALHAHIDCRFTHTAPTGPYRGAGRPEIASLIERLVDCAARETGHDRHDLRRRNFIRALPYTTAHGVRYDSGDFAGLYARALQAADVAGFASRRAASAARGRRRGLGVSSFIEATAGAAREGAAIVWNGDAQAFELRLGTGASGQSHETVFPALVARILGLPEAALRLAGAEHEEALAGGTSIASRSLVSAGSALQACARALVEAGREAAARQLEVSAADIEYTLQPEDGRERGAYRVKGTDRSLTLTALAAALAQAQQTLAARAEIDTPPTFPNGCYVAEVEIDPQTGALQLSRFTCVDDNGTLVSPVVVQAQLHGGVAQGLGQALLEHCVYDPDSGQLLTGSLMDYALPRADDLPMIETTAHPVPSTANVLGAKGAGEAGTTGSIAALVGAACDALDIDHLDTPLTPERLWRSAQRGAVG